MTSTQSIGWWRRLQQSFAAGMQARAFGPWSTRVREVARRGGRRFVSLDDLALLCLEDHEVASFLARMDVDAASLRAQLQERLAALDPTADRSGARALDGHLVNAPSFALASALGRAIGRNPRSLRITALDVLPECLRKGDPSLIRELFAERNEDRRTLAERIAHGCLVDDLIAHEEGPPDGLGILVMHNDDFTTQVLVAQLLEDVVGLSRGDAVAMMLTVHREGQDVVYEGPWEEAARLRDELRRRSIADEAPLYVELRPR